jgi:hypothetical protein
LPENTNCLVKSANFHCKGIAKGLIKVAANPENRLRNPEVLGILPVLRRVLRTLSGSFAWL